MLTALLAWFVFKENFDRRIALGMLSIVAGAIALNWQPGATAGDFIGPAAIVGACLAWALDNNLTRKVSLSDPVQIAMIKGVVAGPVSLGISYLLGGVLPPLATVGLGAVTGFLGYGVSLVLFVLALRHLGIARTGAYFSIAPFVGAVVSVPLAFVLPIMSDLLRSCNLACKRLDRHRGGLPLVGQRTATCRMGVSITVACLDDV